MRSLGPGVLRLGQGAVTGVAADTVPPAGPRRARSAGSRMPPMGPRTATAAGTVPPAVRHTARPSGPRMSLQVGLRGRRPLDLGALPVGLHTVQSGLRTRNRAMGIATCSAARPQDERLAKRRAASDARWCLPGRRSRGARRLQRGRPPRPRRRAREPHSRVRGARPRLRPLSPEQYRLQPEPDRMNDARRARRGMAGRTAP